RWPTRAGDWLPPECGSRVGEAAGTAGSAGGATGGGRRRRIRDPCPRERRGYPIASQLVPPCRKLHDVLRGIGGKRNRPARRRITHRRAVAHWCAVAHRRIVVGRRVVRWVVRGCRIDHGRSAGYHRERERRSDELAWDE